MLEVIQKANTESLNNLKSFNKDTEKLSFQNKRVNSLALTILGDFLLFRAAHFGLQSLVYGLSLPTFTFAFGLVIVAHDLFQVALNISPSKYGNTNLKEIGKDFANNSLLENMGKHANSLTEDVTRNGLADTATNIIKQADEIQNPQTKEEKIKSMFENTLVFKHVHDFFEKETKKQPTKEQTA